MISLSYFGLIQETWVFGLSNRKIPCKSYVSSALLWASRYKNIESLTFNSIPVDGASYITTSTEIRLPNCILCLPNNVLISLSGEIPLTRKQTAIEAICLAYYWHLNDCTEINYPIDYEFMDTLNKLSEKYDNLNDPILLPKTDSDLAITKTRKVPQL